MLRVGSMLDLKNIQGLILRDYELEHALHVVVSIKSGGAARRLLSKLVAGEDGALKVTAVTDVTSGLPRALNIGVTYAGLAALKLPGLAGEQDLARAFESFSVFRAGAAARARVLGDVGASAPDQWIGGLGTDDCHLVFSIHCATQEQLSDAVGELRALYADSCCELHVFEGKMLPEGKVHFGYRDNLSQPAIDGDPLPLRYPDGRPPAQSWEFVLSGAADARYRIKAPAALFVDGSFAAFRVMRQDVHAFERMLAANSDQIDPELLAAKLCGRWRNGIPLELSPLSNHPDPPLPEEKLNDFSYDVTDPGAAGRRCPLTAHIRRAHPRGMRVVGGSGSHRLIRRGIPYGPPLEDWRVEDCIERGLLGYFICADLEEQFEYVLSQWMNEGAFFLDAGIPRADSDPLITNRAGSCYAPIPLNDGSVLHVRGLSPFVTTRGMAYLFLPSLRALLLMGAADL